MAQTHGDRIDALEERIDALEAQLKRHGIHLDLAEEPAGEEEEAEGEETGEKSEDQE